MPESMELVLLLALGTWAALDGISVGQFMIARPVVSGTLAGWILGDPIIGFWVGGILEGAHLGGLPVGAARLPEPGPAAVAAVAGASAVGGGEGVAAGAVIGILLSVLGGGTVSLQRRANGWITREVALGRVTARGLALRHWGCVALDGLRGLLLTAFGLALAGGLMDGIGRVGWRFDGTGSAPLLVLPGLLAAGALLRGWLHPPRLRIALLLLGSLIGALLARIA